MSTDKGVLTAGSLRVAPLLLPSLARNWGVLLLRGIAAIAFGVLAFVWPGVTLITLVFLFGAYALLDGIFAIAAAISGGTRAPRWWLVIVGLLGIAAGILSFAWPGVTALTLLLFIAAWAIAAGVFQIIGAILLRKEIDNEWLLILSGLLSVVVGIVLLVQPGAGALALIWVIAAFSIAFGVMLVAFALRLRGFRGHGSEIRGQNPPSAVRSG